MATKAQYFKATVDDGTSSVDFITNATVSSILDCRGTSPTGLHIGSQFTPCNVNFLVRKNAQDPFVELTNPDGTPYTVVVSNVPCWIWLPPSIFNSINWVILTTSLAQDVANTVDFALAPIFQGLHN